MLHLAVSAQFSTHLPSSIMVIILDLARNYPRDTFRIFHVHFQDFKHQIYQGAPCKEITIKLFNPPRTPEIFMLAFQTSMLVHTHFDSSI
jgi:hypothetical protein